MSGKEFKVMITQAEVDAVKAVQEALGDVDRQTAVRWVLSNYSGKAAKDLNTLKANLEQVLDKYPMREKTQNPREETLDEVTTIPRTEITAEDTFALLLG